MNVNWKKALLLSGTTMAMLVVCAGTAQAADTAPPADGVSSDKVNDDQIVVTGSRITKAGFEAPTPTTVVDSASLAAAPQPNVAQNLNQLPVLSGSITPRTAGNGAGGGLQGANFLNLRNLGVNRTLILLDHRRVVGSATNGAVDLNLLPSTLLKRVEVVTGGASAAWGSDAVAGVINLMLDKNYTGVKGTAQFGTSNYGDANEYRIDLAAGHAFAGGRGHILASVSYSRGDSVDRLDTRPWYVGAKLFTNTVASGLPRLYVANNVGSSTATTGGLITAYRVGATNVTSGGLVGTQFLNGGATSAFNFGTVGTTVTGLGSTALPISYAGSQLQINGTPNDFSVYDQLLADTRQISGFLRTSFDITDNINLYGEFIYGKTQADSLSVPYLTMAPNGSPLTIQRTNAYLPGAVGTQMDTLGASSFTLGRFNLDLGFAAPHNQRELIRYVAGADIELGGTWKAQIYYEHATSKVLNQIRNDAIVSNFALAVDAVQVTAANVGASGLAVGSIACRSSLTTPTNGCVPFNPFGPQSPTAAQKAYLLGTAFQNITLTEDVVSASINGDLFELPAGSVSLAAGAEYRRENHNADADANSQRNNTNTAAGTGNWWVGNYKPSTGGYNVKEGFAEIAVPIFKDSALGRQFDFNGAIRVTDYSTSGTVTTWKAGATWDIAGGFKLRGVLSRDIRAPNLAEYFLGGTSNTLSVVDGSNGAVGVQRIQSGNPLLKPEIAKTLTVGAIYQPVEVPGLSFAVDFFKINISNAIATPQPQYIVDRCRDGTIPAMCSLLIRNSSNVLTTVLAQPLNYKTEYMSGVDFEFGYRVPVGAGTLALRSLWTVTARHYLIDNGTVDSLLGELASNGSGPNKVRGFNTLTYDTDRLTVSLRHRFIGKGVFDAAFTTQDIVNNDVPAVSYVDFSVTGKLKTAFADFEIFGSVDNLFNKAPPMVPTIGGNPNTVLGTPAGVYDTVGRYFRAGIRFKM